MFRYIAHEIAASVARRPRVLIAVVALALFATQGVAAEVAGPETVVADISDPSTSELGYGHRGPSEN